ncbi:ExeM/NucH family extracellular endonuclease [Nakamurella alba]|uniref:ExeM/NucH family extracellular endonuclease n=1 Tax=Nakamurella alba TaxID=2665158 RepID=UPI002AC31374|nr:ExeM/NucH family extracellular endonuclease [Nakamurella alba]
MGATALTAVLLTGSVTLAPAASAAVDPAAAVVINEVYGGGGNSGATLQHDFIELYNTTDAAVDLTGWSVQYASAAGTSWQRTALTGSIAPGQYYVVVEAQGAGGTVPVTGDVTGTIAMSGTAGKVALVSSGTTGLTCGNACPEAAEVVDFVGYGSTAASHAGDAPTPAPSNTTSVFRDADSTNTGENADDFTAGAPTPGEPTPGEEEPPAAGTVTIAEIQGTGAASPLAGQSATTRGIVTAAYPVGGFNAYTIQTPGTGGPLDVSGAAVASQGLFVFSAATVADVAIGDHVEVTGTVGEFSGRTELSVAAGGLTVLAEEAAPVTPTTTDGWPTTDAQREALESMLYLPTGDFTVSDVYSTNQYGEVGLASGTTPLIQPTDVARPGSTEAAAVTADNASRAVVLDDGASTNFLSAANSSQTPPYLSLTAPVRVGAPATFASPVVVDYQFGDWRFQPVSQVTPADTAAYPATFGNTRQATPDTAKIGAADLKVSSFNVQNYFTTLGADVAGCSSYKDRTGTPITVNTCPGNGPRGAWDATNLERQQAKIVRAINDSGADVAGLEEIENSVTLGKPADSALATLVDALNADAGSEVWAYVPSSTELPAADTMDVITSAIIYKPAAVTRTGESRALGTESADNGADSGAFANAREPVGQVFTPVGGGESFFFVVNHFKSKGSAGPFAGDADAGDGQGASNESRKRQAAALVAWIPTVLDDTATQAVVMVGDYNSYGQEDPVKVLTDAGYVDVEAHVAAETGEREYSYSFSGLSGSLDHVFVNSAALDRTTGADIWNINAAESIALNYSRYNYHGTLFWDPATPFAASDHDPVVVGLTAGAVSTSTTVQVLGINDFHGRIQANQTEAGAAVLSGAVDQLRAEYPSTVFAAAGDLVGASTFESFIAKDKPTIDALNAAGLEVSAVGNHEFDQGYEDLTERIMAPYDPVTNPYGGAEWEYLGANVRHEDDHSAALPESWVQDFGSVQVGFVGVVTDHLDELVSPAGIEGLEIEAPVLAANRTAAELKAEGADIVVMLVHEGAATTALSAATDPSTDFGRIVTGASEDIDAIVSGHTHLTYNHQIPVQSWIDEGRAVTTRPVVSAGQYGYNLDQLLFTVDNATGDVTGVESNTLPLVTTTVTQNPDGTSTTTYTPNYPADPEVTPIVAAAVAEADVLGAQELGQIEGPFNRAKLANGTSENRGGESTLGNLVAEVQRWATTAPESGAAQIAFMNPGGLRADMVGNAGAAGTYPAALTYKQAATVQPFANTLVNMDLTGAQIKQVLEQQWQPAGASRPFLKLGISEGFTYTYDPAKAAGSRITGMWLDGEPIADATAYSVTVNSFLSSGGDNFTALSGGTDKRDTGKTDLQAMVDYMAANTPLPVDYTQRAVGVSFPADAPAEYEAGQTVSFSLSSLAYTTAADRKDTSVELSLGGTVVGTATVDNTIGTDVFDENGKASVTFEVPAGTEAGAQVLTVTGTTTGTVVLVPLQIAAAASTVETTTTLSANRTSQVYGYPVRITLTATVVAGDGSVVPGSVEFRAGDLVLGSAPISGGVARFTLPASTPAGSAPVTAVYAGTEALQASESAPVTLTVQKAPSATLLLTNRLVQKYGTSQVTLSGGTLVPFNPVAGTLVLKANGTEVARAATTGGLLSYKLPANTPVGTYRFTVTFVPSSPNVAGSVSNTVPVVVRR